MSEQFKIEDGVPLPTGGRGKYGEFYTALEKLQPGQSFEVPASYMTGKCDASTIVSTWARDKGLKKQFVTRRTQNGFRIWRRQALLQ